MFHSRIFIAAALLVAGAFLASPAMADASKNGGPPTHTVSKNGGPPTKNGGCTSNCGGGGGGCGVGCGETKYVCVINGRRFFVNDWRQCTPRPHYACDCAPPRHVVIHHHYRRPPVHHVRVCGCEENAGYEGGYGYYAGGSLAARMQAERRSGSYAMTDGGVYAEGDAYGYGEEDYMVRRRHHKMWHGAYSYNPGYVIHYGPTISKDGGY